MKNKMQYIIDNTSVIILFILTICTGSMLESEYLSIAEFVHIYLIGISILYIIYQVLTLCNKRITKKLYK